MATTTTGISLHHLLLGEVYSTSTIVKGVENIGVEQGMLMRDQLKEKEDVDGKKKKNY